MFFCAFQQLASPDIGVEVYVPRRMPQVQLEFCRDFDNQKSTRYYIKAIDLQSDVIEISLIVLKVDSSNTLKEGENGFFVGEARMGIGRRYDTASSSWNLPDIKRLIIIAERVETDTGTWIVDNPEGRVDLRAVVTYGANAIPSAKFVPKQ